MKIIITGGHLSPALAVLDSLQEKSDVLIVGRKHTFEGDSNPSFEYQTVQDLKIPFKSITTARLQRTFTKHTIPSLLKLPIGFFQAFKILKDFKPYVILSFGGYISLPVVLMGAILRIPIVIHEQSLQAGLANRIASIFANKICISWKQSEKFFPKQKTVITGNPLKKFQISNFKYPISNEKLPLIYITGGSAGSHSINTLAEGCIEELLKKFRIIHQTGDSLEFNDFDRLKDLHEKLNDKLKKRYFITKFINAKEVGSVLNSADVVVSRSGINTVSELIYFGKPALLIPLNNEQMENAQFMRSLGLAEVAIIEDLSSQELLNKIEKIAENKDNYAKNTAFAKKSINIHAANELISVLEKVVNDAKN